MLSSYLPPVYFPFGEEERIPKKICICAGCRRDIVVGDDIWRIGGKKYCENCITAAHDVADTEE